MFFPHNNVFHGATENHIVPPADRDRHSIEEKNKRKGATGWRKSDHFKHCITRYHLCGPAENQD
jgi:hypothetical protein